MIKAPELLEQLRKQDLKNAASFSARLRRYEEMYKLAGKLNPDIVKGGSGKHVGYLIQLAETFRKISDKKKYAAE